jgi:hypothetical protein
MLSRSGSFVVVMEIRHLLGSVARKDLEGISKPIPQGSVASLAADTDGKEVLQVSLYIFLLLSTGLLSA